MDTDVLVVGAGPTGLMLATQLARRNIRTLIIDRHSGPSVETRALGVQARTLEIYSHLGIAEQALALGKQATGGNIWAKGKRRARIGLGDAGEGATPYPFVLILGQDDNERLLGEQLRQLGHSVEWNTELAGLLQNQNSVTAWLQTPGGSRRTVKAAYVAGCDGARSTVRDANDIAFAGEAYEHVFFVADTELKGSMTPDEVNVYLFRNGFHLLFPMRGKDHWRIAGILPEDLRDKPGVQFTDVIPSLHNEAGEEFSVRSSSWFSTYRIHHRRAVRFRDRRCFLLGDAAHIHSPVGAQGMNTGLQDAYNLAWKLALVIEHGAEPSLLDSYEEERIPVAQALLNGTDRAFRVVVSNTRLAGLLRTQVLARLAAFAVNRRAVQRLAFRTISQTGIHYGHSRLSKAAGIMPATAPKPGDRFPLLRLRFAAGGASEDVFQKFGDSHFSLLSLGLPSPLNDHGALQGLLRTYTLPDSRENRAEFVRAGMPVPCFYLVRPDGYIGLCGTQLPSGAIAAYAAESLRLPFRAVAASAAAGQLA